MISVILKRLREGRVGLKVREPVYRPFSPFPFPQDHSCLKDPFPWRIAAQTRHQLLRPCPACGHAVSAHTYDQPCPLCLLEQQVHAMSRTRKRSK